MQPMSLNKLAGLSYCIGAALITIPFLLQITAGGTPEEGTLIWRYFSNILPALEATNSEALVICRRIIIKSKDRSINNQI